MNQDFWAELEQYEAGGATDFYSEQEQWQNTEMYCCSEFMFNIEKIAVYTFCQKSDINNFFYNYIVLIFIIILFYSTVI